MKIHMDDKQVALLQSIADNPLTLNDVREAVLQAIKDSACLRELDNKISSEVIVYGDDEKPVTISQ